MNQITPPKKTSLLSAFPLLLAIFIDGMGLGILFPLINTIVLDPHASILPAHYSLLMREFLYGITVSVFMVFWFFGAAILGDLSDVLGRKKPLIICLVGSGLGYLLSAIAVFMNSISLLIIGRIIDGFTAGSQPIAQAAIIDISTPEHKTRNLGLVLFAASIGFIFGPLIGGFLSDSRLVSWFNLATPLYFATFISFANALLIHVYFHETFTKTSAINLKLHHAIHLFISAFKHPKVRELSMILLLFMIGWSSYYTILAMFLLLRFGYDPTMVSLFMALLAIGFGIATGFLIDYFASRHPLSKTIIISALLGALMVALSIITPYPLLAWLAVAPLGAFVALTYTGLLSLFSSQVDDASQGWVMGVTGSISAFAFAVTSLIAPLISHLYLTLPMILASICMVITAATMYKYRDIR